MSRASGTKVLVVGGGGREHALAATLARAPSVREVWTAPGNPGTEAIGPRALLGVGETERVADFARQEGFDLVVVGPEAPLVAGLADAVRERGIPCFGPSAAAARIEGSKAFAKTLCARAGVPTAPFHVCSTVDETLAAVRALGLPVAIKADGLAAGKGVRLVHDVEDARAFAWLALNDAVFGDAGRRLVVEAFLEGEEASLFVVTDGERWHALPPARDYKRLGTGDLGPNTGGMGAYAPAELDAAEHREVADRIVEPTLRALAAEGAPFRGLLYCGLMRTASGPQVLEFNCRFGDPETQALLPLWQSDLAETLYGAATGALGDAPRFAGGACVAVVLASPGYPDSPRGGGRLGGVERAERHPGVQVFHAATRLDEGVLVAGAGRVLAVSAVAERRAEARARAYAALAEIHLEGGQYRSDVGAEGEAPVPGSEGAEGAEARSAWRR